MIFLLVLLSTPEHFITLFSLSSAQLRARQGEQMTFMVWYWPGIWPVPNHNNAQVLILILILITLLVACGKWAKIASNGLDLNHFKAVPASG